MKRAWVLTLAAIFVGIWIPALFLLGRQEEPEGTLPPEPVQTAPADRTEAVQTVPSGDSLDGTMLLQVLMSDGTVEQKPLDDYLAGVILAEMPASFGEEALKAQAVVSRTYTLRQTARNKHDSADICTDPGCCQGWISYEDYCAKAGEAGPDGAQAAAQAVKATDGQVLVYDGGLIDATFFSCSGGRTETAVEVWGSDVPYLQSVDSPGEEAPHNEDTISFSTEEFSARILSQNPAADLSGSPESWFGAVSATEGGRGGGPGDWRGFLHRKGAAQPFGPALHGICCQCDGRRDLFPDPGLWTPGGHEPVRRTGHGSGGKRL